MPASGVLPVPTCDICCTEYCSSDNSMPYSLSCGHTMCKKCVAGWSKESGGSQCPFCRKPINLAASVRNYAMEDTVKMIKTYFSQQSSMEHELNCLKIDTSESQQKIELLERETALMKLQLAVAKQKLDDIEFEEKIMEIMRAENSEQHPNLDNVHEKARHWIELNEDLGAVKEKNVAETMKKLRLDYLTKLKDRICFNDPIHGQVKLGRNEMKRIYQFVGRMSYRQLLTYTVLGEMSVDQQNRMKSFFVTLAESLRIQNRFKGEVQ